MAEITASPLKMLFTPPENRLRLLLEGGQASCEVVLPDQRKLTFGPAPYAFRLVYHSWKPLRGLIDEFSFIRSYIEGEFDIEGDLMSLCEARVRLKDMPRLGGVLRFITDLFVRPATTVNRGAIKWHYSFGDDFYHSFIDTDHHFYSHGIFHSDNESIEQASENKLAQIFEALDLKPGMHLLDIGGGWGPIVNYCSRRGVKVTALTIAPDSHTYITKLIERNSYDAKVILEDFLEHRPAQPYDAIVILGVIEHIPRYRRFAGRVWECLKPGGKLYLDASATREKYDLSNFSKTYIFPGAHSFMCLQDVIQELLYHGLDVLRVRDETRDYELTALEWARRFDAKRDQIISRWGDAVYRAFRVYLWSGCFALRIREMQAYHLVARRGSDPGPRPNVMQRAKSFVTSLR